MGEVRTLPGVTNTSAPATAQPQQEIIDTLEYLLKGARSGELQAIAYVSVRSGGQIGHGWNGAARGHTLELVAGIACLEHRYHHEATHSSDSEPFGGGEPA